MLLCLVIYTFLLYMLVSFLKSRINRGNTRILKKKLCFTEEDDFYFMKKAIHAANVGRREGGIPIGAVLVTQEENGLYTIRGIGRNRRVQLGSATRHGEIDCLENVGRLDAVVYRRSTMYTTLSPCEMCTGAILLFGIPRVVIGENTTFMGSEDLLRMRGVEVVNLDLDECKEMMNFFISNNPDVWNEDIGK
jgi:creatinine deaminase